MHNNLSFEICLSQLLNILNISGNKLAKALNVDPSLISKWKNGKRKICTNSNYLELISIYLADNIVNEHQKENIINLINSFNISIDAKSSNNMSKYIHKILIVSTQSSSSVQNKNTTIENIGNDYFKSLLNTNALFENDDVNNTSLHSQQNICSKYGYLSNLEVIIGNKNVIHAGLDLLKTLPKKPSHINEPILITFFTELDSFSNFEETYYEWNNTLLETQKKGWNINKFTRLSENKNKNMDIIKELLMNLELERYCSYFFNKYDTLLNFREFIIVPGVGALICLCSISTKKFDSAFLLRDKQALNLIKNVLDQYTIHSIPLINSKYNINNVDLLSEIATFEESNGNRFVFNHYINHFIIPLNNCTKYLSLNKDKLSDIEISERILINKRRLETFNKQIKNYKFYDIWHKKSIEDLIKDSEHTVTHIKPFDILLQLENTIKMLEENNNYQIALLNDINTNNINNVSWMIKESHTVLIQNHLKNTNIERYNLDNDMCISITEPTLVNRFNNYFWELWNEIAPISKDKKYVISWIKSQIKVLNNL